MLELQILMNDTEFSSTAEFMLHKLHIEESEVPRMCLELYREHGTTMAGLKVKTVLPQLP